MRTGRPEHYIPHPSTVLHDVKVIFTNAQNQIAKMLQVSRVPPTLLVLFSTTHQEYQGELSFTISV